MEHQDGTFDSALTERAGVTQPGTINPAFAAGAAIRRPALPRTDELVDGILSGNRTLLSRAITLVESSLPAHQKIAQEVIERCLPHSGKSLRLGITGVPGAGKSTFIEALGSHLVRSGHKLAVLAIDPSSERSKGSILGDTTRMEELSGMKDAFIRPSPSAGSLGGVARKTRET
ncbi:MAG: ATP/GTP-binding protein, partial [Bacteroidales bacterium]|nr:ATP/GTP-binding protein [Bacteroidales bacterium]